MISGNEDHTDYDLSLEFILSPSKRKIPEYASKIRPFCDYIVCYNSFGANHLNQSNNEERSVILTANEYDAVQIKISASLSLSGMYKKFLLFRN